MKKITNFISIIDLLYRSIFICKHNYNNIILGEMYHLGSNSYCTITGYSFWVYDITKSPDGIYSTRYHRLVVVKNRSLHDLISKLLKKSTSIDLDVITRDGRFQKLFN